MTPKRKAPVPPVARSAEPLYREIRSVLEAARAGAYRAVNAAMVQAYWQVGRLIVEHEQKGRCRAGWYMNEAAEQHWSTRQPIPDVSRASQHECSRFETRRVSDRAR